MADYSSFFQAHAAQLQQAALFRPFPNPTFRNPAFAAAPWRALIVRLSPWRDVERSTPHLFLAQAVRRAVPEAYVDFAFLPPAGDRARYTAARVPWLCGLQSGRSGADFDAVLISNAYTLELINVPVLLRHSDIPVMAEDRDATWPPFILGGSNALSSQALVRPDAGSLVDAIFFGEGEGQVEKLVQTLYKHRALPRAERLEKAARAVKSLWVTGAWPAKPVRKSMVAEFAAQPGLTDYPLLNGEEAGTGRVQISQGCPAFCSFCAEGFDRKPYREVPLAQVLATARELQRRQGCHELDLYSFNFNTHSDIPALLLELNRSFDRVSFKSQRLDFLVWSPKLLDGEVAAGKSTFTLGIEGISERMRSFLHKSLETDMIKRVLERLLGLPVREIKLFFILTGHEKTVDIEEFRTFVAEVRDLHRRLNPGIRMLFSAGMLVRQRGTPLQFDRLYLDPADYRAIEAQVRNICATFYFEYRLAVPFAEYAAGQTLALGGYWLHEIVLALAAKDYLYDEELPPAYWDELAAWLKAQGHLDSEFPRTKSEEYEFPFAFVQGSVKPKFLYSQFLEAKEKNDEGYCLGADAAPGACFGCGACPDAEHREWLVSHRLHQPADAAWLERLRALMHAKARLQPVYLRVRLGPELVGTWPERLHARVFQALLAAYPELQGNLLAVQESLFGVRFPDQKGLAFCGETVLACKAWEVDKLLARVSAPPAVATPEVAVLGALAVFAPGEYARVQATLKIATADGAAVANALAKFLREAGVVYTLRRAGDGYVLDVPDKIRKRRILLSASYRLAPAEFALTLEAGPKLELPALCAALASPAAPAPMLVVDQLTLS